VSVILAYVGVIFIWSTTPLAIKWSSDGWGYLFAVSARMVIGAIFCLIVMAVFKQKLQLHKDAIRTYFAASVGIYGAMLLVYWGAQFVPSGLIAVLFGLNPIVTGIFASIWLRESNFTFGRITGTLLGFSGVVIIFSADIGLNNWALKGVIAILISVFLHAGSAVCVKRIATDLPALSVTGGSLLIASCLYILTWLVFGNPELQMSDFQLKAGLALVYLSILGSVLGFTLYFYILKKLDVSKVALVTLVTPVLALILGRVLNNETIPLTVLLGSGCIIAALVLHQWADIFIKHVKNAKPLTLS